MRNSQPLILDHAARPIERLPHAGRSKSRLGLHVNHRKTTARVLDQVIRDVTSRPSAVVALDQERLGRDPHDFRIEIQEQKSPQLKLGLMPNLRTHRG